MKKYFFVYLLLFTSSAAFSQRCNNHTTQIQSLYNQLVNQGFDTKIPTTYHYFFIDQNEQDLHQLKEALLKQNYRYVRMSKQTGKFQLEVEKLEAHNANSAINKGKALTELAKANNVETYDGFELTSEEIVDEKENLSTFKQEIEKTATTELYKKALFYYDANENEKALIVFDRCISQNVNLAVSYYKRANCKTALGRTNEAIIDLKSALKINPNYFEANFNLGGLYFEQNNFSEALKSYEKAVVINPKSDNGFYRLAETYQQMGMKNAAVQNCQRALQINPTNEYAKKLMAVLK